MKSYIKTRTVQSIVRDIKKGKLYWKQVSRENRTSGTERKSLC